ncbi:unnamed protein product [Brachionus calyciflorus]|uniref:Major facilitator superfamily (MFS) profile domain-containing protein n=1 Tax=Brachionus calyciflorus TaxID=104777 RepID=A0A813M2F3_9BILA|nr:unnamed protein product [Brachionus calyciflorus]
MNKSRLSGCFDVDAKSSSEFTRSKDSVKKSESLDLIEIDSNRVQYLYFRRWLILFLFSFICLLNSFQLNLYTDIQNVIVMIYRPGSPDDKSSQYNSVNWLSMIYLVANILCIIPAILINGCIGFRFCCLMGVSLSCVGSWVKYVSIRPAIFEVLFLGQVICGISQSFINFCLIRISALWFSKNEVATAISVGLLSSKLGSLVSFIIMPYLITKRNTPDQNEFYFNIVYLTISILVSLSLLASLLLVKDQPDKPPSLAQVEIRKKNKENTSRSYNDKFTDTLTSCLEIWSKRNFIFIAISHGFLIGSTYSLSFLLNQILFENYYQEESNKIGIIELFLLVSGIFGSLLSGLLIDYTKSFKILIVTSYSFSFVLMVVFTITIDFDIWFPFCSIFLFGFFIGAYIPISYEYAIEKTYPTSEGTSCGFLIIISSIFGMVLTYSQGFLTVQLGVFYGNFLLCILVLVGLIMTTTLGTGYKRQNIYEDNRNSKTSSKINFEREDSQSSKNYRN